MLVNISYCNLWLSVQDPRIYLMLLLSFISFTVSSSGMQKWRTLVFCVLESTRVLRISLSETDSDWFICQNSQIFVDIATRKATLYRLPFLFYFIIIIIIMLIWVFLIS